MTYADEEEERKRMGVFRDNLRQVVESTPSSYSLGLNQFSDMTWCVRVYYDRRLVCMCWYGVWDSACVLG